MVGGAAAAGAGAALLRALSGAAGRPNEPAPPLAAAGGGEGGWARRALDVYHDAVAAGYRPRLHVLERLLACLRLPHQRPDGGLLAPLQVRARPAACAAHACSLAVCPGPACCACRAVLVCSQLAARCAAAALAHVYFMLGAVTGHTLRSCRASACLGRCPLHAAPPAACMLFTCSMCARALPGGRALTSAREAAHPGARARLNPAGRGRRPRTPRPQRRAAAPRRCCRPTAAASCARSTRARSACWRRPSRWAPCRSLASRPPRPSTCAACRPA